MHATHLSVTSKPMANCFSSSKLTYYTVLEPLSKEELKPLQPAHQTHYKSARKAEFSFRSYLASLFLLARKKRNSSRGKMDLRVMGFEPSIVDTLHEFLDFPDEADKPHPSRAYIRDAKAMAATPADVKDCPNAYVVVIDMPGLQRDQVKVQVEEGNLLVVSGERKREKEREQGVKYIKMERRLGKFLKKFQLPENADTEKISASYQDGVLTVIVEKKPPPEPKKPKTVEVQVS